MLDNILKGEKGAGAGIAFMVAVAASVDIFSAVMSSPWSTETFGTEETLPSVWRYVGHAIVLSIVVGLVGAYLDAGVYALAGVGVAIGYMLYLYWSAVQKAQGK